MVDNLIALPPENHNAISEEQNNPENDDTNNDIANNEVKGLILALHSPSNLVFQTYPIFYWCFNLQHKLIYYVLNKKNICLFFFLFTIKP